MHTDSKRQEDIAMGTKKVPDGYHSVTPYIVCDGVSDVIDFITKAFDAKEITRMARPDGKVMHAEVKIGDSFIMFGEPLEPSKARLGSVYMYVEDTDAVYKRAVKAGGKSVMEPADQFYGDRNAGVIDESGNYWWIATHIEDVSHEEIEKRAKAHAKEHATAH
jgi:PhnB protein